MAVFKPILLNRITCYMRSVKNRIECTTAFAQLLYTRKNYFPFKCLYFYNEVQQLHFVLSLGVLIVKIAIRILINNCS
jgi:hypothetical protein